METRNAPQVDENDPDSQAVEVVLEKIDLQKKPKGDRGNKSPGAEAPPPGGQARNPKNQQ
jgi:hypothetical protein